MERWLATVALGLLMAAGVCHAGIDHRVSVDDSGIWNRNVQYAVEYGTIAAELTGAFWLGGDDPLGKTFWKAMDSSTFGAISSEAMKHIFTRARPSQTPDPNQWFQGSGHYSFPSGEVTLVTSAVTPFIFEYGCDHPTVYALTLLPVYDAIARVKAGGHWQTDVIAGAALGTLTGYIAHRRENPFILSVLPHSITIGIHKQF